MTESRRAFRELLELLGQIDTQIVGETGEYKSALDVADGHRFILHGLRRALGSQLEADTRRPVFQRAITPTTKFGGDSPDAIYHECNVSADCSYRIRGNMAGAVYVSLSVQSGGGEAEGVGASINSEQFEVRPDGSFEILLSRAPPADSRNWVHMPEGALNVLTRHYFEEAGSARWPTPRGGWTSRSPRSATSPRRASPPWRASPRASRRPPRWMRSRTLEGIEGPHDDARLGIHRAEPPQRAREARRRHGLCRARYRLRDGALSRAAGQGAGDEGPLLPPAATPGVVLWSRFRQSFDYMNRRVSLNRAQTVTDGAGNYRIVLAERDPGVPNWLDTGGRASGMMYWRFLLPEEPVAAPQCELVDIEALRG